LLQLCDIVLKGTHSQCEQQPPASHAQHQQQNLLQLQQGQLQQNPTQQQQQQGQQEQQHRQQQWQLSEALSHAARAQLPAFQSQYLVVLAGGMSRAQRYAPHTMLFDAIAGGSCVCVCA
jgi:hypothetical protein